MPKRVAVGVVTGDKAAKTRRVEIPRLVKHSRYGKYVRRKTICYAHDENETSQAGDLVEIIESRPRSRLKRWELVRVVEKGRLIDLAAVRAAARAGRGGRQEVGEGGLEEPGGDSDLSPRAENLEGAGDSLPPDSAI
jgi:small subunit ribosomal protein S17